MRTRQLGNSDLEITPIGLGVGSPSAMAHGHANGVNWIDCGDASSQGEEEAGRFLQSLGDGGLPYVFVTGDATRPDTLESSVDATLRRLQRDCIDLYQIKGGPNADVKTAANVAKALQMAGKVRFVGAVDLSSTQLERAHAVVPLVSMQAPLQGGSDGEAVAFCQQAGIGLIHRPASGEDARLKQTLEIIAEEHHVSPTTVSIAWILRDAAVTGTLVGAEAPEEVDAYMDAVKLHLSVLDVARLEACTKR